MPGMLQRLLIERFRLAAHWGQQEAKIVALLVDENGPKLKPSDSKTEVSPNPSPAELRARFKGKDGCPETPPDVPRTVIMTFNGRTKLQAKHESMGQFVERLTDLRGEPVVDMTGLPGEYDFSLSWSSESAAPSPGVSGADDCLGPSLFSAVRQLGLRLERRKSPIKTLIIDHVEHLIEE